MPDLPPPRRVARDEDQRQRARLKALLAFIVIVLMAVVVALGIVSESSESKSGVRLSDYWPLIGLGCILFFGLIVAVDTLTPRRKLSTISAILFGGFAGLIVTLLMGMVIDYFVSTYLPSPDKNTLQQVFMIKVIMGLGMCYLGATTVLQTQDDFRLVIPYVEFAKQLRGAKPLILDTSALVDGRIQDIAEVGLLQTPLVIPGFVIEELQALGDSSDKMKRARGRRGLEVVAKLQRSPRLDLTLDETPVQGKDVDAMIVELARLMPGSIVTTDIGLNRVASIQGVSVLNINDLANALKPNVIPGEPLRVSLLKRGEQPGQGVGYLEDGTMVIAENGESAIGSDVTLIVKSTMQTSAGRLIFGRIDEHAGDAEAGDSGVHDAQGGRGDDDAPGPGTFRPRPRTHRNPRRG
ncbi:MAG: PIN/TRAM domain-containing protein [Planctomycetes bacterium]|nr:PIN/TRAM domain-containing protein [Planctomycetota bacterium]